MKIIKVLFVIIVITCCYNCERDDICAASTQTTANLIIEAFDVDNPTQNRDIRNLRIQGIGNDAPLLVDGVEITSQTNMLSLPLRTDADVTQFILQRDFTVDDQGMPNGGNSDTITVSYTREDRFISRACGFSTIYTNVTVVLEDENDDDLWISQLRQENQTIEDEEEAHFSLFH